MIIRGVSWLQFPVAPMYMNLYSLQPTYITFQCLYLLHIAASTKLASPTY